LFCKWLRQRQRQQLFPMLLLLLLVARACKTPLLQRLRLLLLPWEWAERRVLLRVPLL
jgi:hypothetical protein